VQAGRIDTALIDRTPALATGPGDVPPAARALAAATFAASMTVTIDQRDPWRALSGWRAGGPPTMTVLLDDRAIRVAGTGPYVVDGRTVARDELAGHWLVDGESAIAVCDGADIWVKWRGETYVIDTAGRERSIDALAGSEITAPMPGVVLAVHAHAGQRVKRGDLVCVVEAMKMELRVEAPGDGTVTKVLCAQGDQVRRGQRLAEFEAA
jgi:3-methylcrotonyl-CoA carboxylase alpha subunit